MITSSLLFILLGSYLFYLSSQKSILSGRLRFETWIKSNSKIGRLLGILFLIVALFPAIIAFGNVSGVLFWLASLMLLLCLVVIIAPLKRVSHIHSILLFIVLFIFEIL